MDEKKLIFYLGIDDIKKLSDEIIRIKDLQPKLSEDKEDIDSKDSGLLVKAYSEITNLLRNDIKKGLDGNDAINNAANELSVLWIKFGIQPIEKLALDMVTSQDNNVIRPTPSTTEENNEMPLQDTLNKKGFVQAWHFAMLGDKQLDAIGEGKINELSLIEYEEEWRTNLLKQVSENDIVFLFRRGGYGYVGAFKPLGWRIFDYNEQKETLHFFGQQEQVKPVNDDDVMNYDIYNGRDDGADLCSNLIVEPIAYVPDGVGNPGGVYRRTISRYDAGYAATLLELFKK